MQFNTFLSCDTRKQNVCLNRTEGVPQVVSPLLKDPTEIVRTVGCQAPPPAVPTRMAPPPVRAPAPKRREKFADEDDDSVDDVETYEDADEQILLA